MKAGDRTRLITFQRKFFTENAAGEPVEGTPTTLGTEYARVTFGTGQERRDAAYEGNEQAASFAVLFNSVTDGVTTKDMISWQGTWDITSKALLGREGIEFSATRRVE